MELIITQGVKRDRQTERERERESGLGWAGKENVCSYRTKSISGQI
jgi:hypothetical protein